MTYLNNLKNWQNWRTPGRYETQPRDYKTISKQQLNELHLH